VRDGGRYTPAGDSDAACATTDASASASADAGTAGVNGETAADA
jgi:hypothetical protein